MVGDKEMTIEDGTEASPGSTRLDVFADYKQFTLEDEWVGAWAVPPHWGEHLSTRKIASVPEVPGALGVGTVRSMDVPVDVVIGTAEPTDQFTRWDHVTEGSCHARRSSRCRSEPARGARRPNAARLPIPGITRWPAVPRRW